MTAFRKFAIFYALFIFFSIGNLFAQTEAEIYTDYKTNPKQSILPDFSYAGYQNGEKQIDYSAKNLPIYNVIDFGAVANDNISDKSAIKAAIAAALNSNGGVIFFPTGRFIVQDATDDLTSYIINKSNIILKGTGSGSGGTELFMKTPLEPSDPNLFYSTPSLFIVGSGSSAINPTSITANAETGDFDIIAASSTGLVVGDWVLFEMQSTDAASLRLDIGNYTVNPDWTSLKNGGVDLSFVLQIKKIVGNTITLKQPLPYPINSSLNWKLSKYRYTEEMGVEDIAFVGNFQKSFVHHGSALDDSGYSLLQFKRLVNSWMRNCRFTDVSVAASIGISGANITIDNCIITGNGGHQAINNAGATNVLISNIDDRAGQWHSVGVSKTSMNTVLHNVTYPANTCFESHASQPRNTLLDNVSGGLLANRGGGDLSQMPNHMRNLVFWNYNKTNTTNQSFDFWPSDPYWKIPFPIVVGFHGQSNTTFIQNQLKYQESNGAAVLPTSLYNAQLQLRLSNLTAGYGEWGVTQSIYNYNLNGDTGSSLNFISGSSESSFSNQGFLPIPPSGKTRVQVNGTNTGGNGFSINNSVNTTAASINITANSANSLNKFSGYDIENSTEIASMFFNINFNSIATNGTYVWALGNKNSAGSLFTSSSAVFKANTELFTSFEWVIKTNSIDFKFRESADAAVGVRPLINSTSFTRGANHAVEVYANNSTVSKTYTRNEITFTVPSKKFHIWVNGVQLSYSSSFDFPKSINTTNTVVDELEINLPLNAYLFYGNNSTLPSENSATATISNIRLNYNASTLPVSAGRWINQGTLNSWNYNFAGWIDAAFSSTGENLSTSNNSFLPAPPSGTARVFTPSNSIGNAFNLFSTQNKLEIVQNSSSGVTKFSAYNISNASEVSSMILNFTFSKAGNNPIPNGANYIWSMGHRGSLNTIYSNSNSVFTAANSFSNGVGNLFNAVRFNYNLTNDEYELSNRILGNTAGIYENLDGGNLSLNVPYRLEVFSNNSSISQSYQRGNNFYHVAAGCYHLWVTNLLTNTSKRYTVNTTLNYNIPKSVETVSTGPEGNANIPVNKPLNAFLVHGNSGTNGTAKLTINGGISMGFGTTTLPVSLLSFKGKKEVNGIRLIWETSSELNNDYFELLRSVEDANFNTLTKVYSKGNSHQLNTYSYLDNGANADINYYKLKQVDKDGSSVLFDILVAVNNGLTDKEVYTIRFKEETQLNVIFNTTIISNAIIKLTDLTGRIVFQETFLTKKGINNFLLEVPNLNKGIYVATLIENGKSKSIKLIK